MRWNYLRIHILPIYKNNTIIAYINIYMLILLIQDYIYYPITEHIINIKFCKLKKMKLILNIFFII